MSEVTRILSGVEQGDPHAAEQLLPLVYDELRKLAAQKLSLEKPGQTLNPTALVHEAYLRLVQPTNGASAHVDGPWNHRGHFFAAAAEAMRRILVESARRKLADKRGGQHHRQELHDVELAEPADDEEMLAVNDLLDHLATMDPVAASLVKLRFFVGLTMEDVARALDISVRSAYETWAYARSWFHRRLRAE
jgi:RNA polymerase sigma factor (TIGR02999 family)